MGPEKPAQVNMAVELYKPEEATRSRGLLAVLIASLLGYGIYSLYEWLQMDFWQMDLIGGALGDEFIHRENDAVRGCAVHDPGTVA